MSLSNIQNQGGPIGTPGLPKTQKTTKRVADIILNKNHAAYTGPDSIGIIFFTDEKTKEYANDPTTLPRAKPLNLNNFTTPLIGELVNIIQSTSDDYYPDLGGNSNFTSNYYTPAINVYNNAGSNAVPLDTRIGKGNKKSKTSQSEPTFEFQKEFSSVGSQSVVVKMCNNYLVNHGYPSGRSDPRAPTYTLFPGSNGGFILKLDDSEENKVKLGSYYRENSNQSNLNPTEGGTVNQGKNGQRISFSANNKAQYGGDLGMDEQNRAMVLSLGDGETENINDDDGTIHLATNQKVNIKTSSDLIASLHSEYKPYVEPLKEIEKKPAIAIPTTNPTPELQVQDLFSGLGGTVTEVTPIIIPSASVDPFFDPVFDALDDALEEGLITFKDHSFPDSIFITPRPEVITPTDDEIVITDPNHGQHADYTPPANKPTFYPPYPYTGPSPNADRLRGFLNEVGNNYKYKEKVIDTLNIGELSNGGDMDNGVVDYMIAILRKIKELMPSLKVVLTGGNDQFHHKLSYTSRHASGRGCDFVIHPSTKENIKQMDTILRGFLAGNYPAAAFINEYDNPTKAASGKHFHVSWREDGGTEANTTKQQSLAQVEAGEILAYTV